MIHRIFQTIVYFVNGGEDYIETMHINLCDSQNSQVMNFPTFKAHNSCIWILVQELSIPKISLKNLSNGISHYNQRWFDPFVDYICDQKLNCQFYSLQFSWPQLMYWISKWKIQSHFRHLLFKSFSKGLKKTQFGQVLIPLTLL